MTIGRGGGSVNSGGRGRESRITNYEIRLGGDVRVLGSAGEIVLKALDFPPPKIGGGQVGVDKSSQFKTLCIFAGLWRRGSG